VIEIKERYFDNTEQTKVFFSSPWTLEHSIARSSLGDQFENIFLNCNYVKEKNRSDQKKEWEAFTDKNVRATKVYTFLLDKELSKPRVAQEFSKYLMNVLNIVGNRKIKIVTAKNCLKLTN
jgi:putative ATP-dependent endonuclease of OLD family